MEHAGRFTLVSERRFDHASRMDDDFATLRQTLESIAPFTDREWTEISPHLQHRGFSRGGILQRAGVYPETIYFVTDGLVREYYIHADGTEYIKSIITGGRFCAAYSDYLQDRDAHVTIQALKDTRTVAFPFSVFAKLRDANLRWETINRRLLEELYVYKDRREFEFFTMSAAERYLLLCEQFPEIENLISQYHIASYLGITPIALSRIRGQLRRGRR